MALSSRIASICLGLMVGSTLLLTGCTPKTPAYVDTGATYTTQTVTSAYDRADISKLAGEPTSASVKLRHDALTRLRSRGDGAATVADLLTKVFPADTRGVPVYVERAVVNGKPAIIMIEATGPKTGKLTTERLWVFDEQGGVIFAGTK